jgi:hypothetical protein
LPAQSFWRLSAIHYSLAARPQQQGDLSLFRITENYDRWHFDGRHYRAVRHFLSKEQKIMTIALAMLFPTCFALHGFHMEDT